MAIKSSLGVKVLILPLSLAMVVVILIIFAKPAFDSMKANRKALADSQKKLSDLQSQTRKLSELKEAFETFEEKKIIAAALPENESPEDYLNELYQRASRSGVLISSFTAATKKGSSGELAYICGADAASSGSTTGAASAGASVPAQSRLLPLVSSFHPLIFPWKEIGNSFSISISIWPIQTGLPMWRKYQSVPRDNQHPKAQARTC
ncbi:MAG: hypothetical protein UW66_C0004G0015 [Candidatus Moranbacteria bacterium GW2011_GWF1_44_4]|nr:MAG: hypothetical protein UW66_C0004G0015 [Candidatus Moranbacteria bacterium GW2011_GWF1_44_4]